MLRYLEKSNKKAEEILQNFNTYVAIKKDKLFRHFWTVLNRPYVSITLVIHSIPAESIFRVNHKTYILGKKLLKLVFSKARVKCFPIPPSWRISSGDEKSIFSQSWFLICHYIESRSSLWSVTGRRQTTFPHNTISHFLKWPRVVVSIINLVSTSH